MKIINILKEKAGSLKKKLTAIYYAYKNPKLSLIPKIIIIITLGYALSPIDLIPDFIPILGYLDDLIIIPALIALSLKLIPSDIFNDAEKKAEEEPLTLKKNRVTAVLFILIWVSIIYLIIIKIM